MERIIGLILLIYGVLGIALTLVAYIRAQTPLSEFRRLLADIGQTLEQIGAAALRFGPDVQQRGTDILAALDRELTARAGQLEGSAGSLNRIKETLVGIAEALDVFRVPDGLETRTINILDIRIEIPTGLRFGEPLKPVAGDLEAVARQLGDVERTVERFRASVEQAERVIPQQATPLLADAAVFIEQGGRDLQEARQCVLAVSKSPVLSLVPLVVLAYLGLIHVAFSLTGLAFIL